MHRKLYVELNLGSLNYGLGEVSDCYLGNMLGMPFFLSVLQKVGMIYIKF